MNERIREINREAQAYATKIVGDDADYFNVWVDIFKDKLAELIVKDYAKQLVQANMSNREYAQAMDEHYEQKWAHRLD
jgi:hypothetical protein